MGLDCVPANTPQQQGLLMAKDCFRNNFGIDGAPKASQVPELISGTTAVELVLDLFSLSLPQCSASTRYGETAVAVVLGVQTTLCRDELQLKGLLIE